MDRNRLKVRGCSWGLFEVLEGEIISYLFDFVFLCGRDIFWKINENWYKGNKDIVIYYIFILEILY